MKSRKRVHRRRKNGLYNKNAPFWKGERAENIVEKRIAGYQKKKKNRKSGKRRT